MHLERKFFPRIEQLGQDGETRRVGHSGTKNLGAVVKPKLVQGFSAPRSLPNDALRLRPVGDFPGFADDFPGREFLPVEALEETPAPDALHEERFKQEGRDGRALHFRAEVNPGAPVCQTTFAV